jgi:hypothetical protein
LDDCAVLASPAASLVPTALGKVFAVFLTVGLAGDGGELEVPSVGGGFEGVNVEGAREDERVGAAGALSGSRTGKEFLRVGDAVAVAVVPSATSVGPAIQ